MKKIINTILFCAALSLVVMQNAFGGESVVIIVNAANSQQLSEQQIKNIYSDIVTQWDNGEKIEVFNLHVDDESREAFSQKVFGESARKLASAELNRKITNTIKNPSRTKNARLVAKLVAKKPNAIGYIPISLVKEVSNVRIVMQID